MEEVFVGEGSVSLEQVEKVSCQQAKVCFLDQTKEKVQKAHYFLNQKLKSGAIIYGVNTGFGLLAKERIRKEDLKKLQANLIRSHACGVGAPLSKEQVRAMMFVRAHALAQGHSGCRSEVIDRLIQFLEKDVVPFIPSQGTVGASGDLAPLAHMAQVLMGEGKAFFQGCWRSGKEVLQQIGMKPIVWEPKEGVSFINGTTLMTALGVLTYLEAKYLLQSAIAISALSVEAFRGSWIPFDEGLHQVRKQVGQIQVGAWMRSYLSGESSIHQSHQNCDRIQDPYSFRCIAQVYGAILDVFKHVESILQRELHAVTDNPILFPKQGKILSGGNFHGEPLAMAFDILTIALCELGSLSHERMSRLIDPQWSELPPFLTDQSGLQSGFMMTQVTSASLVSENKTLAHPAVVDSLPTSGGKEDHVSMGGWAVRKTQKVLCNVQHVLAIEALMSAQGIDFLRPLRSTEKLEKLYQNIRTWVPVLEEDRSLHEAIELLSKKMQSRTFLQGVE